MNITDYIREHPSVLAYLFVIILGFYALWGIERQSREIGYQSEMRSYILCTEHNELKGVMKFILDTAEHTTDIDDGERTEAQAQRREQFREIVDPYLEPEECPPMPNRR